MHRLIALTLLTLAGCNYVANRPLTLAERNMPATHTIVLPENPSASQSYAATELQSYIAQMTGVILEITDDSYPLPPKAIILGKTRYTSRIAGYDPDLKDLGEDGFHLMARPPHLLIIGSNVRGTLYGVYELLEQYGGCRWYASWHNVIPTLHKFDINRNLDDLQKPAFLMREPFWFDVMRNADFAARNKVNGNSMGLQDKHGGNSYRFGKNMWSCHTFDSLLPVAKYFDTNPEYFSMVKGKRIRTLTQLCLTNPDVLRIVTSNTLDRIRKDPTARFYGVSQNDWYNPCECPTCKAVDDREGSHAGTMIEFVNKIAEEVEKEFPHATIETLAYQYTRKPPKNVKPRHNVMPCLCTIECDFSQPLDVSTHKENQAFMQDIIGWRDISKQLYVWDYTTNFRYYTSPTPNIYSLQRNAQFLRDSGVDYLFEQGGYQGRHADFAELKAWLLAKWLWNPELELEALLNDFLNGYYGAAAPLIRSYIDELHAIYHSDNKPWSIFTNLPNPNLSEDFLTISYALWQQAEALVKDNPAISYNVRMSAISIMHAYLAELSKNNKPKRLWVTTNPEQHTPSELMVTLARELLARFKEGKDIRISEDMRREKETLNEWQATITFSSANQKAQHSAFIEESMVNLVKPGIWGKFVDDPLAEDGKALMLTNTHFEWCSSLPFNQIAFDPGKIYRIRARIRVDKTGTNSDLEAFWVGVYDPTNKRSCGGREIKLARVKDGYHWYDIATWEPRSDHYFWIGPGRFDTKAMVAHPGHKGVYLDKLELSILGELP